MKRGFTIIELMATIIILAIVTLIAVSGYRIISGKIKQTAYENKVSLIETKAANYADDTGFLATNVDNLVKLGYIEADDESGHIIDPRDGKYLNCHVVNIQNDESNLYGQFTDKEECDNDKIEVVNMHLGIHIYSTSDNHSKGDLINNNTWVRNNVILEAYFKDSTVNINEVKKIIWRSNIGRDERVISGDFNSKNQLLVEAAQIIHTTYFVSIEMNNGTLYQAQVIVKIDKQRPIIYDGEISIPHQGEYTATGKEVRIGASDGNGSGIYGYYLGTDNRCTAVTYEESHENTFSKVFDTVGTYFVCVRDNVGNLAEDVSTKSFVIDRIDTTPPSCELQASGTMGNNGYFISDVSISFKTAVDNESGVNHTLIDIPQINFDTNGTRVTGTVVDNAGNSSTCSMNVKMDKTPPTCSLKANGTLGINSWYISNIDIDFDNKNDNMSGVAFSRISENHITTNTSGKRIVGLIEDNAGNLNFCETYVKKDSTSPSIHAISNPLNLNADPYSFSNNIQATFGVSGAYCQPAMIGSTPVCVNPSAISCSPSSSHGSGSYDVSCTAMSNNGLASSLSFHVNHSYPAIPYSCTVSCHPHDCKICPGGWDRCCSVGDTGDCNCPPGAGDDCFNAMCCQGDQIDTTCYDWCDTTCYKCNPGDGSTLNNLTHQCEF